MRLVVVSLVCLLATACANSPEQERRMVCTAFCDCLHDTPATVEACIVDDCFPDLPSASDACLSCVYENSQMCPMLFNDCIDVCFPHQPQPRDFGGMR